MSQFLNKKYCKKPQLSVTKLCFMTMKFLKNAKKKRNKYCKKIFIAL